ncbi:hypothetical protein [Absidia glauca]|uniref:Cytochrome P450 n=1 Tax=Absidia glauca TaxID=4829 RepID=A0A163JA83_ABSGL|nr:hypothetical protein [Absidia glauca]
MLVSVIKEVMYSEKLKNQYTLPCIVAAIATLGSVILIQRRQSEIEDDGIATVPYILPLFGSTLLHNRNELKFAKETAEKYGPVYRAHLFGKIVTVVGAGHAEEVFTHPNMSFNASQEKKFKASHFFMDSPFELRKNSIQDSIVKELTPKLKQYSPRAYLEVQKKLNSTSC